MYHCKLYCLVLFVCQYSISQTLPFEKASDFTILKQVVHVQCFVQSGKIVRLCWSAGHGYKWRVRRYIHFGSLYVSGKLPTYPSPKPILTLTSQLRQNVGLGEG